jgi:DNA polymerase-3 subunit gamma/tau
LQDLNRKIFGHEEVFLGHEVVKKELAAIMDHGRMHPIMLLEGRSGIGKRHLAWWLAARWLCKAGSNKDKAPCGVCGNCKEIAHGVHNDIFVIDHRGETITTAEIEAMQNHLGMLSSDGIRIALIMDADQMNIAACNRALKTLEEPGSQVRIILTSSRPLALPATILGRCLRWKMPKLPKQDVIDWMKLQIKRYDKSKNMDLTQLEETASRAGWSPGQIIAEIEDANENDQGIRIAVRSLLNAVRPSEVIKIASDLARVRKVSVPQFLKVLEWELSQCYATHFAGNVKPALLEESAKIRRERRRLISEIRKISVIGKVVLNTQLVAESIGLVRWNGVER